MHSDIQNPGRIEKVPETFQPYLYLARIDRPVGVWLLLLPGWWSIVLASGSIGGFGLGSAWLMVLFCIGAFVMRAAGCVINDLWDRKLDSAVERTRARPLASGQVTIVQALCFLTILLLVGFCILLLMNGTTILLGLLSIPLIILYPFMKRVTFWPQAFLGLTFNFGALMGWSAVTGSLTLAPLCLYIACIFWTLGYDTIYAHQDKEDDALIGVKSTALKFGVQSKKWVSVFYALALIFVGVAILMSGAPLFCLTGVLIMAAHMIWQVRTWDMDDPASSLTVFKSNRDFGLIVLVVMGLTSYF